MKDAMKNLHRANLLLVLAVTGLLGGCAANQAPTLYQWGGYEKQVDTYLRGNSPDVEAQARAMEADLQKIRAAGGAVPPGYQAHMGLLYGKQGKLDDFAKQLQAEKAQFPESSTFVDFLLRNFKK